jgi:hypothetical protein
MPNNTRPGRTRSFFQGLFHTISFSGSDNDKEQHYIKMVKLSSVVFLPLMSGFVASALDVPTSMSKTKSPKVCQSKATGKGKGAGEDKGTKTPGNEKGAGEGKGTKTPGKEKGAKCTSVPTSAPTSRPSNEECLGSSVCNELGWLCGELGRRKLGFVVNCLASRRLESDLMFALMPHDHPDRLSRILQEGLELPCPAMLHRRS